MTEWHETLVQGGFVFLVISAMIYDVSALRVPNWVPLALATLFFYHGATSETWEVIALHALVGACVLAAGFSLFSAGVLGGGDAKFAAALALWTGPAYLGAFLLLTSLLGGIAALGLLGFRKLLVLHPALESRPAIAKPAAWARAGKLPYALPLGLAALILGPGLFS